ncbi:MAG: hypothetical protein A2Y34_05510 [Spirochaetes bacterium GWC1_27_15]|nr:MAG: hypothetical protein A2Y34_05510 [Spirochaetes bacterium GWC1_27_15]
MAPKYIDTNVLLLYSKEVFDKYLDVQLSGFVLGELDKLKKFGNTEEVKYQARRATRNIEANKDKITYIIDETDYNNLPSCYDKDIMDNKIISLLKEQHDKDNTFVAFSNDLLFRAKCKSLNIPCEKFEPLDSNDDTYTGYSIVDMSEYELANWYESEAKSNLWNLNINEYLLIQVNNSIVDKYRWTQNGFKSIVKKDFKSMMFGNLKPKDIFQELCIDSLHNNQFTAITGKPGSGKSLCSLMYIMWALQYQKYDSCVIMYNPTKVRGAVDMGYYSGNSVEKGMQQFIGNMLITKFGDKSIVNNLITQDKIRLIPMADSRGMEITDNQILYITEAQNTTPDLMKLALSRCSKDAKIIIEGDPYQQVDKVEYVGKNNGLLRAIEVFKNEDMFGCVHLPNVWRSKIADLSDKM